jgi:hypothetical protein
LSGYCLQEADLNANPLTVETIRQLVAAVEQDEPHIGVLSTGEAAVALVLNRPDLLPSSYPRILDAVDRLGDDWLQAAIDVHKSRR